MKKSQSNYHSAISSLEQLAEKDIQYGDNSRFSSPSKATHPSLGSSLGGVFNDMSSTSTHTTRSVNNSPPKNELGDDDLEDCVVLEVDTADGRIEELRLFRHDNPKKKLEIFALANTI